MKWIDAENFDTVIVNTDKGSVFLNDVFENGPNGELRSVVIDGELFTADRVTFAYEENREDIRVSLDEFDTYDFEPGTYLIWDDGALLISPSHLIVE